jgi:hypothetical protein
MLNSLLFNCLIQHSVHVLMTAILFREASLRVMILFIQNQHDSIIFKLYDDVETILYACFDE